MGTHKQTHRPPRIRTCDECGTTFEQAGAGGPRRWCYECIPLNATSSHYARLKTATSGTHDITCEWCHQTKTVPTKRRTYCSPACYRDACRHAQTQPDPSRYELRYNECPACGRTWRPPGRNAPGNGNLICSDECRRIYHKAFTRYPPAVRLEVLERDNYICHICRKKIPRHDPTMGPRSPTVDHLIPWSEGGTDDPANLAAAHRGCNTRRHTTGPAQLRLGV